MPTEDNAAVQADATKAVDAATAVLEHPNIESVGTLVNAAPVIEHDFAPLVPTALKETKAGYKTTEFWLGIVSSILVALGTLPTPHDAKGIVIAGIVAVYAVARGLAKAGVPTVDKDPAAAAPAVPEPTSSVGE